MRSILIGAALVLALAGCGKKDDGAPKSMAEVKAEAGKLQKMTPGEYENSMQITKFEIPGMPPAQAEQMKQMMAAQGNQKSKFCLTKEQAEKGGEDMFKKLAQGECTFTAFDVQGSNVTGNMTCKTPQGGTGTIAMRGTVSAQGSSVDMDMTVEEKMMPGGKANIAMHVESKRLGDCAAGATAG